MKFKFFSLLAIVSLFSACTTQLDNDDQLFTGLKPIKYDNYDENEHFANTQLELEAALATAPNGALFGSSYYRSPFPYSLWIYNQFHDSESVVGKWINKSFGNEPVLMSNVNPALRSSVAENVLQNNGYFRGSVDYDIVYGKFKTTKTDTVARPRTAKIQYNVNLGELFRIDSVRFTNFDADMEKLRFRENTLLKPGEPFSVSTLDAERTRLYNLFRNHGYYYYEQPYTSYLADTLQSPGKVQLQLQLTDSLPEASLKRWVIGKTFVKIQRNSREEITDTLNRRYLYILHGGKKSPIRPRVILQDVKMRTGDIFSEDAYEESMNRLASKGVFSSVGIEFTPRVNPDGSFYTIDDTIPDTKTGERRVGAGVLFMDVNCVLDKPYDVSLQANYLGKTSGRMGPGVSLGFTQRNAFRGGEQLSFNLGANYEFQYGGSTDEEASYDVRGDVTVSIPRLWIPKFIYNPRRRWQTTPSTLVSLSRETINRSGYFRRHILAAELAYTFQPSAQTRHKITPILLEYDRLSSLSSTYQEMVSKSAIMMSNLEDFYLQKMRYQYSYTSPASFSNPIYINASITESSNLLALGYMACGYGWKERNKKVFNAPFAQFVKLDAEWRKTWRFDDNNTVVAHASAGIIKTFGNSVNAPFSEYYYIGGANDLRGFSARSIGPGSYRATDTRLQYLTNVGDMKFVMNLEYRPRIFGSLYGAVFLDAGNIWNFKNSNIGDSETSEQTVGGGVHNVTLYSGTDVLHLQNLAKNIALSTGVGIRYDLDFFVLRVDWGLALHTPYDTGISSYFNAGSFKSAQCLNFAIGYPF